MQTPEGPQGTAAVGRGRICEEERMPSQDDIRLARIVLKKAWLPKETLEQALREVEEIKGHDPAMTLAHYLGLKELLDWEKIEWVLDLLAAHPPSPEGTAAPEPWKRLSQRL